MAATEDGEVLKVLIIGNSGVGKTAFLFRYANKLFSNNFPSTVGVAFRNQTVDYNGKKMKVQIWVSYLLSVFELKS